MPATVGTFFTHVCCQAKTDYKDVYYLAGKSPGFFTIDIGPGARKVYVCPESLHYIHYDNKTEISSEDT